MFYLASFWEITSSAPPVLVTGIKSHCLSLMWPEYSILLSDTHSLPLDSFTVSLHIPNCRLFKLCKGLKNGSNSHWFYDLRMYWTFISLWTSDTIWRHKSGSTLAQVMACWLTAPSHFLNQCRLIISKLQWHSQSVTRLFHSLLAHSDRQVIPTACQRLANAGTANHLCLYIDWQVSSIIRARFNIKMSNNGCDYLSMP